MRWSLQRQLLYAFSFLAVAILVGVGTWYFFFYNEPTCSDSVQNQNESGIDCGGVCASLCEAPRVSALWARAVPVATGVYHAVALVRNPEPNAGTGALPYAFQLFDEKNILIAERRGTTFLKPGETIPFFEANIITGERKPARTFLVLGTASWVTMSRYESPVVITSRELDQQKLILSATLENTSARAVGPVVITALVYDESDLVIGASQTKVDRMLGKGTRDIVFTWQKPFEKPVVRTEIVARLPWEDEGR